MLRFARNWRVSASIILAITGCSYDKATAPIVPPPPGAGGPFAGNWVVSWGAPSAIGVRCRFPSMILELQQVGDSVFGTYQSHGLAACLVEGQLYDGYVAGGRGHVVGTATVNGEEFNFGDAYFNVSGYAAPQTLHGQLNWTVGFQGSNVGSVDVTSDWSAQRLPWSPPASAPFDIQLYPDLLGILQGASAQIRDTVRSIGGVGVPGVPHFSTLDTSVVGISLGGVVVGRAGRFRLYTAIARDSDAYSEAVGIVVPGGSSVRATPGSLAINRTSGTQLATVVLDSSGDTLSYVVPTYTSTAPLVASVSSDGFVQAGDSVGRAVIVIRAGTGVDSVPVDVVALPVFLHVADAVVAPGGSVQLIPAVLDSAELPVPNPSLAFSSGDPSVASVSSAGLVNAIATSGFADITVTDGSLSASARVLVWGGPAPTVVATTQLGGAPFAVAVSPTGAYYVTDGSGGGFYRGDLPSYTLSTRTAAGGSMRSVAFDSGGSRAFIAGLASRSVAVVDVGTNQIVDSIRIPSGIGAALSVAVSPDGSKLLVGCDAALLMYDANTYALLDSISGSEVYHFAFHPTLPRVYATSSGLQVREIDLGTFNVLREWSGGVPEGIAVTPDGSELFVADEDAGLRIIDLTTGAEEHPIAVGGAFGIAIAKGGKLVFIGGVNGGVAVVDLASHIQVAQLPITGLPRRIGTDATGQLIIEANEAGWVDFIK